MKLISDSDYDESYIITVGDVLKAHYLICEYFESETGTVSLSGIKDYNLLASAVSRQSVSLGGKYKYETKIEKAATVFYGLVKNHAFHDGNKRTALLSLLYFLYKTGYVVSGSKRDFETLTECIAADNYDGYKQWEKYKAKEDGKILFIANRISSMTNKRDYSYKTLTYRELQAKLKQYGFELEVCGTQEVNLVYYKKGLFGKVKKQNLYQIGFKGWTKQVGEKSLKCILREVGNKIDIDPGTFYRGGEPMYKLIEEFEGPLSRLRDK